MARPKKSRIVYSMPQSEGFTPLGFDGDCPVEKIILSIDEYEAVRLIDYMSATQEECARSMNISRPTVTNIYDRARFKISKALIEEKILLIEGGDYDVCRSNIKLAKLKGAKEIMKISVTYEDGQIFQHFGHCDNFKVYTIENGKVVSSEVKNTAGSGHGALAGFLKNLGVDILICGGIGGGAQNALADAGITLYGGVSGDADKAVDALIEGTLEYNANVQCNHHVDGHQCGHHGGGHTCGHHEDVK